MIQFSDQLGWVEVSSVITSSFSFPLLSLRILARTNQDMGKILLCSHRRKVESHLATSTVDEMRSCWDNLWLRGYRI